MIALLKRDLRLAVRAGGGFGLALAFFLIVVVLIPFGVGPDTATLSKIAPGVLWVVAIDFLYGLLFAESLIYKRQHAAQLDARPTR